jgi:hypothetical protein
MGGRGLDYRLLLHQFQLTEATIDELLSPEAVGFRLAATDTEIHGPTEFKPLKAVAAANGAVGRTP